MTLALQTLLQAFPHALFDSLAIPHLHPTFKIFRDHAAYLTEIVHRHQIYPEFHPEKASVP